MLTEMGVITTMGKYWNPENKPKEIIKCLRCDFDMVEITPCHMICNNCGSHKDCSEVTIW